MPPAAFLQPIIDRACLVADRTRDAHAVRPLQADGHSPARHVFFHGRHSPACGRQLQQPSIMFVDRFVQIHPATLERASPDSTRQHRGHRETILCFLPSKRIVVRSRRRRPVHDGLFSALRFYPPNRPVAGFSPTAKRGEPKQAAARLGDRTGNRYIFHRRFTPYRGRVATPSKAA